MSDTRPHGVSPRLSAVVDQWLQTRRITEPPRWEALPSGSGHQAWRVQAAGGDWVFRLRVAKPLGYVADHQREQHIWTLAARARLAPPLHHVTNDGALWISDFVTPRGSPLRADQLGRLMHDIHQLPAVSWRLNLSAQFDQYVQGAIARGHDPSLLPDRREHSIAAALATLGTMPACLCHNDLLADNVLGEPSNYRVIDWEYAAMGSPYFDAAAALANLEAGEHGTFLAAVFPQGYASEVLASANIVYDAMARAWRAASDYGYRLTES